MKPTSPLSLLLFLSLTTAAPIPSKLPKDCLHYPNCQSWLRDIFSASSLFNNIKNDHTPSTHLPGRPHFPAHQLYPPSSSPESHREIEEEFNNSPVQPPKDQRPSVALTSNRPLQSSYLLSLTHPALQNPPQGEPRSTSTETLPSKPTSSLPELREEDTARYWATITSESVARKEGQEVATSDGSSNGVVRYGEYRKLAGSAYLRLGQPIVMAREYSDLLVVGIVVLFLAAVVVLEAVEYCGDLRSALYGRRQRRGEIFLEDCEAVKWVDKKPFGLPPAPAAKYKSPLASVREVESYMEKEGLYHD